MTQGDDAKKALQELEAAANWRAEQVTDADAKKFGRATKGVMRDIHVMTMVAQILKELKANPHSDSTRQFLAEYREAMRAKEEAAKSGSARFHTSHSPFDKFMRGESTGGKGDS